MKALIMLFWRIATFRAGPQAIPYSVPLCIGFLFLNTVLAWLHFTQAKLNIDPALLAILLMLATLVFTYLVLLIRSVTKRFVQTVTAIVGLNFLINLATTPLLLIPLYLIKQQYPQLLHAIISFIYIVIVIMINVWVIMINAFIYSEALSLSLLTGLLAAIGLLGINILLYAHFVG